MRYTWSYPLALALVTAFAAGSTPLVAGPFPASSPNARQFASGGADVATTEQKPAVPYQANITVSIASGATGGGDNGNVSPGTQTVLIPAGKRLIVQTVSMYRSGGSTGSTVQIFINASVNGTYAAYALPLATANGASYAGATLNGTFYADGGTELLANAFRNNTTGSETETVSVTGYLVSK